MSKKAKLYTETFVMPDGSTVAVTHGSGNIFADLGLPDAEELQWKSSLVFEIRRIIEAKGLTQVEVAEMIGLDQPKISRLLAGKLSGYSIGRLLRILNRLGHRVEVRVGSEPVKSEEAETVVMVA